MIEPLRQFETTISSNVMKGKEAIVTATGAKAIAAKLNELIKAHNALEAENKELRHLWEQNEGWLVELKAAYNEHTHEVVTGTEHTDLGFQTTKTFRASKPLPPQSSKQDTSK